MLLILLLKDNVNMGRKDKWEIKTYLLTKLLVFCAVIFVVPGADANWAAVDINP